VRISVGQMSYKPLVYVFANTINIPPEKGITGGDRHLIELIKKMIKDQYKIHIFVPEIGRAFLEYYGIKAKFHITSFLDKRHGTLLSFGWYTLKSLFSSPKLVGRSLIYSSSDFLPSVIPAFLTRRKSKGSKWVVAFHLIAPNPLKEAKGQPAVRHASLSISSILSFLSQKFAIFLIKVCADLVLVGDRTTRKFLIESGLSSNKIKMIRIGVDLTLISQVQAERIYDACFVGRFHRQKGLFDLIEIWSHVCNEREGAKLAIVGGGTGRWEERVEREISARRLFQNVDLLGFRIGKDYFKTLKSSKILLFPSLFEGNPIVPLEAMACGLPVVAYDLPVFKEMYDKGIIAVPMRETKKFAQVVLDLLSDEAKYKEISRQALEMASQYQWDLVTRDLLRSLENKLFQSTV